MITAQVIMFWLAVALYVAAAVHLTLTAFFPGRWRENPGIYLAALGMLPHSAGLVLRWIQAGHGPYNQLYEVAASNSWIVMAFYLGLAYKFPGTRKAGILVLPTVFLLLGLGVMSSKEVQAIPATFKTFWLTVHILFAKLAYGAALVGTALSVLYLFKAKKNYAWLNRTYTLEVLDDLSYNFIGLSFVFNSIMIFAGSIWAKNAWGAYWSWDPIETWSLIAWLVYALYLHFRRTMGWRGERAAWLSVVAFAGLLFAVFGTVYFYPTVHTYYLEVK